MKKRVIILSIIVVSIIVLFVYNHYQNKQTKINEQNANKVHIGMKKKDLLKIMGKPNSYKLNDYSNLPNKRRFESYGYSSIISDGFYFTVEGDTVSKISGLKD